MVNFSIPDADKEQLAQLMSGMVACVVIMALLAMVSLIVSRGLSHFWGQPVYFISVQHKSVPISSALPSSVQSSGELRNEQQFHFAAIYERKSSDAAIERLWLQESTYGLGIVSKPG